MTRIVFAAQAGVLAILVGSVAAASTTKPWMSKIRRDHPRLFFNAETWPEVRARALGPARKQYDAMKRRVDGYPDDPKGDSGGPPFEKREVIAGKVHTMTSIRAATEWGPQAMETAFVYRMTGEKRYLERVKKMLAVNVDVYRTCIEQGRAVHWYSESRIGSLAAYDWVYEDLSPAERRAFIVPMLRHVDLVQRGKDKPTVYRINRSNHTTGFYGATNLPWYAGLAAYADGIDDDAARKLLELGHRQHQRLFEYRKQCAGDDGGLASATPAYAMGWYPLAQFNFLHTWRSATGENLAKRWPHLATFPVWVMWNWIPSPDGPKQFGTGDGYHWNNDLNTWALWGHMTQIMHFYGDSHPDCASLAAALRSRCGRKAFAANYAIYPFLMTTGQDAAEPATPRESAVLARHFESLGQIIMRSGWGPDDTYCLLTVGSSVPSHKQYDEGHFTIYKKGFLALDSGTRGISKDFHLRHYYAQTVAHNCVLIHMPDEPFAPYWGPAYPGPEGKTSYGGMRRPTGATVTAFETREHYAYAAADITPCYSDKKCERMVRQFLFVPPNGFVICDRVRTTKPGYAKAWLLHTQNEPVVEGLTFRADENQGRLFCRTLLPKDAKAKKIGGPGKEFWASGKNWELNDAVKQRCRRQLEQTGRPCLFGNWRMEVSPGSERQDDVFLHVIQVGDRSLAKRMSVELVESSEHAGARFVVEGRTVEAVFSTRDKPAGHIRISQNGRRLIDRDLAESVQAQRGLVE